MVKERVYSLSVTLVVFYKFCVRFPIERIVESILKYFANTIGKSKQMHSALVTR